MKQTFSTKIRNLNVMTNIVIRKFIKIQMSEIFQQGMTHFSQNLGPLINRNRCLLSKHSTSWQWRNKLSTDSADIDLVILS